MMMVAVSLTLLVLAPASVPAPVTRAEARVSATITHGVILRSDGDQPGKPLLAGVPRLRPCAAQTATQTAAAPPSCRLIVYDLP